MTSLTKKLKPKTNYVFSLQTRRLAESFKGLNSSLAQSAEELCSWQVNRNILGFSPDFQVPYIYRPTVNRLNKKFKFLH